MVAAIARPQVEARDTMKGEERIVLYYIVKIGLHSLIPLGICSKPKSHNSLAETTNTQWFVLHMTLRRAYDNIHHTENFTDALTLFSMYS